MAQGLQETAIQPREATLQPRDFRRPPYSQETAPTVSPAYPSFRQSIPMVPSVHSLQEGPRGQTTRHKTALQTNREHNAQRRQNTEKALDGKYREIAPRRQIQRKPSRGKVRKLQGMSTEAWCNKPRLKVH